MLHHKEKIILFVGPISSGKTTQRMLLKTWLSNRTNKFVVSFAIPPLAFITNLMLGILRKTLISGTTKKVEKFKLGPVAFFERANPEFLSKTIHLIILFDVLQLLIVNLSIKLLTKLGILVLLEDYIPVHIIEYELYLKLYKKTNIMNFFPLSILMRILYAKSKNTIICVYVYAHKKERLKRSLMRGYDLVDYKKPHDKIRESMLYEITKNFCKKIIYINNSDLDIRLTFQTILNRLSNE